MKKYNNYIKKIIINNTTKLMVLFSLIGILIIIISGLNNNIPLLFLGMAIVMIGYFVYDFSNIVI
jgi:hypothetical protein